MKNEKNLSPEVIAELRLKHLEMLQGAIARMATYSASLKNYCITTVTAISGFAISLQSPLIAMIAILPTLIFALLDGQYLRNERRFRKLFDRVRREDWQTATGFDMDPKIMPGLSFFSTLFSWSILSFYLPVGICVAGLIIFAEVLYGRVL